VYLGDFEHVAPTSKVEVPSTLAECGEVKVIARGQSLVPLMKLHLEAPATLADINNIPRLDAITLSKGHLAVQAPVRHNDFADGPAVKVEN
jgi:CO/xanthine dehydrogenase FAD-binding subunit